MQQTYQQVQQVQKVVEYARMPVNQYTIPGQTYMTPATTQAVTGYQQGYQQGYTQPMATGYGGYVQTYQQPGMYGTGGGYPMNYGTIGGAYPTTGGSAAPVAGATNGQV
eukprot:2795357-Rhodomonas_salina.1